MHTLKVLGFHPYNIKEGPQHWDVLKNKVSDAQLNYFRRFSPNLTDDKILARFVMSPLDLERKNPSFWHGSIHGGASDPRNRAQCGPWRAGRNTACRFPACIRPARARIRRVRDRSARAETPPW